MTDPRSDSDALAVDAVRVTSGNPTDEELAAVIAVLSAVAASAPAPSAHPATPPRLSGWARSQRALRSWDQGNSWS